MLLQLTLICLAKFPNSSSCKLTLIVSKKHQLIVKIIPPSPSAGPLSKGKSRVFYDISPDHPIVAVVGLGPNDASFNELEQVHENHENIRSAVAAGARALREASVDEILVDDCHDPQSAAEGGTLGLFSYDELKSSSHKKRKVKLSLLLANETNTPAWERGVILANGQNLARRLAETPANLMTPTIFTQQARELAEPLGITVKIHDRAWAEEKKMFSFLSVANGSEEPPFLLEVHYNNAPGTKPLVLVGKGITFDSGGISIKPRVNMDKQRADMHGAANVLACVITLATLKSPVNVIALAPLTENLINGKATKPGDVVIASNGKSIQIDNTDAEGRLVLADALHYAHSFDPQAILDIATLTGAMTTSLGSGATGVFSSTSHYWNLLQEAGTKTGDRVWRMPLFNHFTRQTTDSQLADVVNIQKGGGGAGGACVAAAFLREFVTHPNWLHLDMAGVKENSDEVPYLSKGMSGRPLRTLVLFAQSVFSQ